MRLRLVAAVPWTIYQPIGLPALGQDHGRDVALRLADEHLTRAVEEAARIVDPERIEREVRGGAAAEVLHDESARAECSWSATVAAEGSPVCWRAR